MNTSKPRRIYSALRIAWIIASGILLVWSSLPLINYIYNAGVLISIPVAVVSLAVLIRITHNQVYLDVRTIREDEFEYIVAAFTAMDSRQVEG